MGPEGAAVIDNFSFVHQPLTEHGSITARVTSLTGEYSPDGQHSVSGLQPWSKAGILIKDGTKSGSAYAAVMVTGGNGVRMQYNYTHDWRGSPGSVSPGAPQWLRLVRARNLITGYQSADGATWHPIGAATVNGLAATVQVGLFATSPEYVVTKETFAGVDSSGSSTRATARFDNVSLQGAAPGAKWTGTSIGDRQGGDDVFEESSGTFTVTGSGNIAPVVADRGSMSKTVEGGLVGVFAGLIAVIVVAATFMTAEYRRELVHTTFAASPRRGRVLAAKAVVLGAVTFVTGLVAAVSAISLVRVVTGSNGLSTYPVPTLTEVRVVVGTAILLAVTAVLALAVGTAMRRSAGAVSAVVVVVVLPYIMAVASVLPAQAADWLLRITPAAAFAVQQSMSESPLVTASYTPANGYFPLSPWAGMAVLCTYALLALGLATFLLRRRDA